MTSGLSVLAVVAVVGVVAFSILARIVFWRFAKTLAPRERTVLWVVVALAALYVLPRMITSGMEAYRVGADIRRQQGH